MGQHRRVAPRAPELRGAGLLCWAMACGPVLGCSEETSDGAVARAVPPIIRPPVDSTRPGEIAEGTVQAFGFRLPRDMRVTARFPDAIYADGPVPFEGLANYVRERVQTTRIDTGPSKTIFSDATLKADPKRLVLVEVRTLGGKVEMVVRDRTPKPLPPGRTREDILEQSGLTPDGVQDPDKAQ